MEFLVFELIEIPGKGDSLLSSFAIIFTTQVGFVLRKIIQRLINHV